MITIEEHVQRIVAASRGDEQSLIHMIARELQLLHAALPAPAYLESVAGHLEVSCVQDFDLPDGTTFDGPIFLRHAARLVRLTLIDETEDGEERTMQGEIERNRWKNFLDEFSKRNQMRPARLEVIGADIGAQEEEKSLPFVGVSFEPKGSAAGGVEIILGAETKADPGHVTHTVPNVRRIVPLVGIKGVEDGLGVEDGDGGKTLLRFEILPELPDGTSEGRG